MLTEQEIKTDIPEIKKLWTQRNKKFKDWYDLLLMKDKLATKDMESVVVNDPRTSYNMAHYLLTTGELRHSIPILGESSTELEKQSRVENGCIYAWRLIDEERRRGGEPPFISELGFHLLILGWYSMVIAFDKETGRFIPRLWHPFQVFPRFEDGRLVACLHEYKTSIPAAKRKAALNKWSYTPRGNIGRVTIDNYFFLDESGMLQNMILIDDTPVTPVVPREELRLLVSPVGGFPDRGSLETEVVSLSMIGQSFLETNRQANEDLNKWESFQAQILRDSAEGKYNEFSAEAKATPEQLRSRGALFHYSPGEMGIQAILPAPIPLELRAAMFDKQKRIQKGGFSDAVWGLVEKGMAGYVLGMLASSSANQTLFPYMEAKHFVIAECDKFWLSNLKTSKKVFEVRGRLVEKLKPTDIPDDVELVVTSEVATQKDWLERATIANMMEGQVDSNTILDEIYKFRDIQGIKRRKSLDEVLAHPLSKQIEMIAAFRSHADYLDTRGDSKQAALFRQAAQALEAQLGIPPPGAGKPVDVAGAKPGVPEEVTKVRPDLMPPEARGFSPQQLRETVGRGKIRRT